MAACSKSLDESQPLTPVLGDWDQINWLELNLLILPYPPSSTATAFFGLSKELSSPRTTNNPINPTSAGLSSFPLLLGFFLLRSVFSIRGAIFMRKRHDSLRLLWTFGHLLVTYHLPSRGFSLRLSACSSSEKVLGCC